MDNWISNYLINYLWYLLLPIPQANTIVTHMQTVGEGLYPWYLTISGWKSDQLRCSSHLYPDLNLNQNLEKGTEGTSAPLGARSTVSTCSEAQYTRIDGSATKCLSDQRCSDRPPTLILRSVDPTNVLINALGTS